MKITLGFSPCPNDTFIFDALVNQKIDTEGIEFLYSLADVEELNSLAFSEVPDVTKLSFHAFLHLAGIYKLLDAGAALGFGTGPLLISKQNFLLEDVPALKVAIPGEYTTANLLFSLAFGTQVQRQSYVFSDIERAVLSNEVDAGVIIHESRFTYLQKGLHEIIDLGKFWEEKTQLPVPLGGIAVHKRIDKEIANTINSLITKSLNYAIANKPILSEFVTCHAQEMEISVMQKHIDLYVTKYSHSLGAEGRKAVQAMFDMALSKGIIHALPENIFA